MNKYLSRPLTPFVAISLLFTSLLITQFGFVPKAYAITAATVTVPSTTLVSAAGATTNITGISVGGLANGTTYLVAIGLSNQPSGAVLKIQTTTNLTASYGFTSGSNTFTSFTNISFRGALTDVNNGLASLQYISGSAGNSTPSIKITATSYTAGYALNGLNGHYYKSDTPTVATYTQARTNAMATTYKGMSGYLVTITSATENTFVAVNIESAQSIWIGATDEVTEGDWKWDTSGGSPEAGTSFWSGLSGGSAVGSNYASWSSGEPNDAGTGEDYAVTNWGGSSNGLWNDCNNNGCGASRLYVIEYGNNSADAGFTNASSDQTSASFSLSYNPVLSGTSQTLYTTFGNVVLDTITATGGTGTKTFTLSNSPVDSGITIDTSTTNRAVLRIGNAVPAGTYTSTITATDSINLTATFVVTTVVRGTPSYGGSCESGTVTQTFDTSTGAQVEIFNTSGANDASCQFVVPVGVVAVDYLVVAGGGGGASGGGGGGGVVTNREVRNSAGTLVANRRSALAVRASETITVTVGRGGDYRDGGAGTTARSVTNANGSASIFGSIRANGGGAGGRATGAGNSGGSNGGASYDNANGTQNAISLSQVSGATTFGNLGGASAQGTYSAGAGGGGSNGIGGDARRIPYHGSNSTPRTLNSTNTGYTCSDTLPRNYCFNFGGGGNGGAGVVVDILNTGEFNSASQYGCGGGGGVNNNSGETTTGTVSTAGYAELQGPTSTYFYFAAGSYPGEGMEGCSTSGRGSNFALDGSNASDRYRPIFNGTNAQTGFGGGGGGTDPESTLAGNGGSGVVIISYFVNNSACPNNGINSTSTRPLACNFTVSIRAGRDTVTVDPRGTPYSYSDTPTTTARLTIGIDSITITVSNNLFTISAPGTNNPLRGGTYPALYSLTTTGTDTSSAYINVNVTDPAQHTPTRVGINPWVTTFKVPSIVFGTINAVLVCITPRTSNVSGYGNIPTVTMSSVSSNALRTNLANGGIKLEGTVESITANASNFRIVKNSSDTRLLPGNSDRIFDVNVSNTATGGNGSCTGGSESTLTIYRLGYSKKNTTNLPLKNGKQ